MAQRTGQSSNERAGRAAGKGDEFDEEKAMEAYRKIRAGSKKGAAISKRMYEIAKEKMGPNWRDQATPEGGEDNTSHH